MSNVSWANKMPKHLRPACRYCGNTRVFVVDRPDGFLAIWRCDYCQHSFLHLHPCAVDRYEAERQHAKAS